MTATNAEIEAEMKLRAFGESISAIYKSKYEVDEAVVAEEEAAAAEKLQKEMAEEDATIEVGTRVTVEGFSDYPGDAIVTKIFADRSVSVAYDDGSTWSHVWMSPRDRDIYIDEKYKSLEEKCKSLERYSKELEKKCNVLSMTFDLEKKYKSLEEKCNVLVKKNINKQDKINAVKKWLDTYDINITYAMGKELFDILTD